MPEVIPMRTTATPAKLVRWTEEEVYQISGEIIRISKRQMKDPADHRAYRRTIFDAQNVLPANRRRNLDSIQATKNIEQFQDAVKRIMDAQQAAERVQAETKLREEAAAPAAVSTVVAPAEKQASSNPLSQTHGTGPASPRGHAHPHKPVPNVHAQPEVEPLPTPGENMNPPARAFVPKQVEPELPANITGSLDDMFKMAGNMIANTFVDAIMNTLQARMAKELPKLALRAMAVSKTLPKILVIGPLPKQQPMLEEAVDGLVELKFVSSEERANLVNTRGKYCVGAILWSNFVNHSHQAAMQKLFSSENFRIVTGTNLETLKQAVEDIAIQIAH